MDAAFGTRALHGPALEHAQAAVLAAQALLDGLSNEGWHAVIGTTVDSSARVGLGWDTVVERSEELDPFSLDQPFAPR